MRSAEADRLRPMFEGHSIWSDKGYPMIWSGGRNVRLHVYVWERAHGPKPPGHIIHHKDEDKSNYDLDNLVLLSTSDHQRVHDGWKQEGGEWVAKPCTRCGAVLPLEAFYQVRTRTNPSAQCRPCHTTTVREIQLRDHEGRKAYSRAYYQRARATLQNDVAEEIAS